MLCPVIAMLFRNIARYAQESCCLYSRVWESYPCQNNPPITTAGRIMERAELTCRKILAEMNKVPWLFKHTKPHNMSGEERSCQAAGQSVFWWASLHQFLQCCTALSVIWCPILCLHFNSAKWTSCRSGALCRRQRSTTPLCVKARLKSIVIKSNWAGFHRLFSIFSSLCTVIFS